MAEAQFLKTSLCYMKKPEKGSLRTQSCVLNVLLLSLPQSDRANRPSIVGAEKAGRDLCKLCRGEIVASEGACHRAILGERQVSPTQLHDHEQVTPHPPHALVSLAIKWTVSSLYYYSYLMNITL